MGLLIAEILTLIMSQFALVSFGSVILYTVHLLRKTIKLKEQRRFYKLEKFTLIFLLALEIGYFINYEADKRNRLGEEAAKPRRIRFKPITR